MGLVVGLTGGIGSGKSTVGRAFERRGIVVIDADAISRALTAPGGAAMPALRAAFGDAIVDPRGALDRARMRALAFGDPAVKQRLEGILHPMIRAENDRQLAAATSAYTILMIPLLVESGQARARCDRILVVDVPESAQMERVAQRDGLPPEQIRAIMHAQATRAERLAAADDVIENSGTESDLEPQVDRLHAEYLRLAAAAR
jgi:dephospho-CoA kinase